MTLPSLFRNAGITIKSLSIAGLLSLPVTLNAQIPDYQGQVDFNLHLQSVSSDWRYNNKTRRTRINRAGFGWSETLSSYLSAGLLMGYLDLSQAQNPVDAAKMTSGYYAGLQLDGKLVETEYFNVKLNLSFLYNSTQKINADQQVNNVWMQSEAKLLAQVALGQRLNLRLAANIYRISGEQQNSGSISSINNFREDSSTGYSAGLDLIVDSGASIGFDWLAGNREGGRIYFRRRF